MNYTEKITFEQALDLQNKIKAGEMPDIEIYYQYYQTDDHHGNLGSYYLDRCYKDNNDAILLTRSDYATYILGNNPLPDGYGYPSKDLGSGIYDGLPEYYRMLKTGDWNRVNGICINSAMINDYDWYCFAFPLSDLARVEAEAVVSKMERTEINAAQVEWLFTYKPETNFFYYDEDGAEFHWKKFESSDSSLSDRQYKYKLLTSTYNSLPDEFKALAEPKASMPAHFADSTDWKAKYIELEEQHNTLIKHLQEATASADAKQDIINNLEDENKKLKFRLDDLHGYSPKDWKIAELEMQVDFNKDMRKMHLENVSDLHDFYHKIIWNLFEQLEK